MWLITPIRLPLHNESWNDDAWLEPELASGASYGFGRTTIYSDTIPLAGGISESAWQASGGTLGYNYKRNFTVGLATPSGPSDGSAWSVSNPFISAQGISRQASTTFTDATAIACAVNIFGQDSVYSFNAKGYQACKVSFQSPYSGGAGPSGSGTVSPKRKEKNRRGSGVEKKEEKLEMVGEWGGWGIEKIEMIHNPETFIPTPPDVPPPGPLIAAHGLMRGTSRSGRK
ncbi:MAG: hypothetical protein MMC33_001521 [Icmadophila ericetorum]|nr:hypothetical protein [Icmadophila ericetorum]